MWAPFGKKKQLPGLSSWKKNNSCSWNYKTLMNADQNSWNAWAHPPNLPVVTLRSLLLKLFPLFELLRVREWDTVDSLQRLLVSLAFPVSWRVLQKRNITIKSNRVWRFHNTNALWWFSWPWSCRCVWRADLDTSRWVVRTCRRSSMQSLLARLLDVVWTDCTKNKDGRH